jgi:hypothetical protein
VGSTDAAEGYHGRREREVTVDGSNLVVFVAFMVAVGVEQLLFLEAHAWCAGIGLRTLRRQGRLPPDAPVPPPALQESGLVVKPLYAGRYVLTRPRRGTYIGGIGLLEVDADRWTLKAYMPWLTWVLLLLLTGLVVVWGTPHIRGGLAATAPLGILAVAGVVLVYARERRFFRGVADLMDE